MVGGCCHCSRWQLAVDKVVTTWKWWICAHVLKRRTVAPAGIVSVGRERVVLVRLKPFVFASWRESCPLQTEVGKTLSQAAWAPNGEGQEFGFGHLRSQCMSEINVNRILLYIFFYNLILARKRTEFMSQLCHMPIA